MIVNNFYDFQFDPSTGEVASVFYSSNRGKEELNFENLFSKYTKFEKEDSPFTFTNLCKHYSNRILIYSEHHSPYCEKQWWSYANLPLLSAYSRITNVFQTMFGVDPDMDQLPIDYTPVYTDYIYKSILANGLEILWFNSTLLRSTYYVGVNSGVVEPPPYLLLYPIIFKLVEGRYIAYNPELGLTPVDLYEDVSTAYEFLYPRSTNIYKNPVCDLSNKRLCFQLYPMYNLTTFRNIDLSKLNIGSKIATIQGVYNA